MTRKKPHHVPTDKTRQAVSIAKAAGLRDVDICALIGVTEKTLVKHYAEQLSKANAQAIAAVASNLYKRATGDSKEAVTAAIFWLKTRGRWRENEPAQVLATIDPVEVRFIEAKRDD